MRKSEVQRKYDAANSMFEIRPQKKARVTDLDAVKRAAPWVWIFWMSAAAVVRLFGLL